MIVLTFGTHLNARAWAKTLASLPAPLSAVTFRQEGLLGERVVVDLTKVGFADFVTLGRLLVFVRAVSKAGAECSVRLPTVGVLPGEDPQDSEAALRTIQRNNCRLYLEQSGVVEALGPHVDLEARTDPGSTPNASGEASPTPTKSEMPHRHRRILRYRWISAKSAKDITLTTVATEPEVALRELGLRSETAAAVARGIVIELLENAEKHSGASEILLGGVIVHPETYSSRVDDFEPKLRGFATHAAEVGSALIRLVVADTGRGMIQPDHGGEANEFGIAALDSRSSTSEAYQRGAAKGLWKVSRVLRAYQGGLLISTWGKVAGRIHEGSDARDIAYEAADVLPGTFVECAVLARPGSDSLRRAGELVTPRRGRAGNRPDLACITVPLYSLKGLLPADLERIRLLLADPPPGTTGLVVAIKVPHGGDGAHDVEISRCIAQLLNIGAPNAGGHTLTLSFPSVNRPLMAVAVEYVNAEHDEQAGADDVARLPILVLAPDNRHYWVGGTPAQRRVLGRLSCVDGPLPLDAIAAWPDEDTAAMAQLCALPEFLQVTGSNVILRTRPQDAVSALAEWVGSEVGRTIAAVQTDPGQADVWQGRFLTPTLRLTNRWCDLDGLLSRLDLHGLTGITLAAIVEDRLGKPELGSTFRIVRLEHTPAAMVTTFARSLTGPDAYVDSISSLQLIEQAAGEPVRILLVADIVSSGTTVTRALTEVVNREMVPVGVATIIDARAEKERAAHPDHVEFQALRIPLIGLATVDVAASSDSPQAVPIDPVLRRPETGRLAAPRPLIRQSTYVRALQRNAAARLGHIERPADRHYTAYVDPTLLFREEEWTRTVLNELTAKIKGRHRRSFGTNDATACILYPEGTADDLTTVAVQLRRALIAAHLDLVAPVAVPRAAHAANWELPRSLDVPPVKHAVILDSGASSGRTVQQLIGLAADKDAAVITVVLLLNGLNDGDAINLQRIATVRRSPENTQSETASLEVFYVARTAMSNLRGDECAICALRRRYGSVTLYAPIPEALASHRTWLLRMLEPRTKWALFEEQATDLLGANVSQPECVAYLQWRRKLREAARSTVRCQELVMELRAAGGDRVANESLVRLLVAESQWLTSAPLSFPECRSLLANMVATLLVGGGALQIDQMLRVQAVILLAHAAPERFAAELSQILQTNRGQGPVVAQVLLETLLLITGPSGPAPYARQTVIRQLVQSLANLQERLRDANFAPLIASEFVTLPLIRYLLSHARRPLQARPTDAQSAWSVLRHQLQSAGHDYSNTLWLIETDIRLATLGERPDDSDGIRDAWLACANFLNQYILPSAEPLRQILLSKTVLTDMSREEAVRWERTLSAVGSRSVDETTVRLDDLVDKIRTGAHLEADQARELFADLKWWSRFVLGGREALLSKVIDRGPVDVIAFIRTFFHSPADVIDDTRLPPARRSSFLVFCTSRLMKEVFSHIRINAEITHRLAGNDQSFLVELSQPDPERIMITVRNTGSTREPPGGGKGLETLDHRLARFNGAVKEAHAETPWTYAISVSLEKWRIPT